MDYRTLSMREAQKALAANRKSAADAATELELLFCFVERCTLYTMTFGDIDDPFYTAAGKAFSVFVDGLNEQEDDALYQLWSPRIEKIVQLTSHIGWGFGD